MARTKEMPDPFGSRPPRLHTIGVRHCLRPRGTHSRLPAAWRGRRRCQTPSGAGRRGFRSARRRGLASPRIASLRHRRPWRRSRFEAMPDPAFAHDRGQALPPSARDAFPMASSMARTKEMPDPFEPPAAASGRHAEGVWHLLGSRRSVIGDRGADRDSRQCLTPDPHSRLPAAWRKRLALSHHSVSERQAAVAKRRAWLAGVAWRRPASQPRA
jgi:hypothetical protein